MGGKQTLDTPTAEDVDSKSTLLELTATLQEKLKKQDEQFKDIPTPIDFAKLQNDVGHHNNFIYGMLIAVIAIVITVFIALLGGYFHFDTKVSNLNDRITSELKDLSKIHHQLETKINDDSRSINDRIDTLIIQKSRFLEDEKPLED